MKNTHKRFGTQGRRLCARPVVCIATVAVIALLLVSCPTDNGPGTTPGKVDKPSPTLRYQTVPYTGNSGAAGDSDEMYKLIYSAKDDDSNYYIFLLGHVNYVPIAYRQAIIFNGKTPITVGYSKTDTTEETITNSVTTATENTTTYSKENSWNISGTVGVKAGFFNASLTAGFNQAITWEDSETRSTENTYETAFTKSSEESDSMEYTVGEHDESEGKYRLSLFGTTDIFCVLITNKAKTSVKEAYTSVCARPLSYAWGIDYDPDVGGSFAKTAPGDLLTMPDFELTDLPDPTETLVPENLPPPQTVATPTSSKSSGTYQGVQGVFLYCTTSDASIYYTLDGSTPSSANGFKYIDGSGITLRPQAQPYVVKAIAVRDGYQNSVVLTLQLTVGEAFIVAGQTYYIVNFYSQKVMDADQNNKYVHLWENLDLAWQKWEVVASLASPGYFSFRNVHNREYLDVESGNINNQLQHYQGNGTDSQLFKVTESYSGSVRIYSKLNTSYAVTAANSTNHANGTRIVLKWFDGTTSSQWILQKVN